MSMVNHRLNSNGVDESSDRAISKRGYYGVAALILLMLSGVVFNQALAAVTKAVSCLFSPSGGTNMETGSILVAIGFIVLILSLSCAGASLATGQQSILGALVIGLVMLPFLYFLGSVFFGYSMDLSLLSPGQSSIPSVASTGRSQC